jgi:uncharacterized delta-60 repeat protein
MYKTTQTETYKMKAYTCILIATLILSAFSASSSGAWGDYDTTFGSLGIASDGIANHYPEGIALQPDGKILVTGFRYVSGKKRLFLRRYLSNGQVDTSFGNNGSAISNALLSTEANYVGQKIVVQANGRIAVLGIGNNIPSIWRFTSSGTSDSSIGYGGMKQLNGYHPSYTTQIATYSNIHYVGLKRSDLTSGAVIKFNSSGTRDMAFGTSGELIPGSGLGFTLSIESATGNILIGGIRANSSAYGIERFVPTGQLDPTFSHYDTTFDEDALTSAPAFIQLLDGRCVLNEIWYTFSQFGPYNLGSSLVLFTSDGSYTARVVYIPGANTPFFAGSCPDILDQQSNGRIIAKGVHDNKLYRFSTSFSTINTMTCDSYAPISSRTRAILQPDGKMLAAGTYNGTIAIVRTVP